MMDGLTIVTGGAGFIGSHLVNELIEAGRRVRVVERPGANVSHLPPSVEVVFADIRDRKTVAAALQNGRCDFTDVRFDIRGSRGERIIVRGLRAQ